MSGGILRGLKGAMVVQFVQCKSDGTVCLSGNFGPLGPLHDPLPKGRPVSHQSIYVVGLHRVEGGVEVGRRFI